MGGDVSKHLLEQAWHMLVALAPHPLAEVLISFYTKKRDHHSTIRIKPLRTVGTQVKIKKLQGQAGSKVKRRSKSKYPDAIGQNNKHQT